MVCSICGSKTHNRSNTKYHPKRSSNRSSSRKMPITITGKKRHLDKLSKRLGGAKKGLLADLLKGIDLRIKSM